MSNVLIITLGIILVLIMYVVHGLITKTLNDFLENIVKKTLWIWLPFHALGRLTKEFREKYMK